MQTTQIHVNVNTFRETATIECDYKTGESQSILRCDISGNQVSYNNDDDRKKTRGMYIDNIYYEGNIHLEIFSGEVRTLEKQIQFCDDLNGNSVLKSFLGVMRYHESHHSDVLPEYSYDAFFNIQLQVPPQIYRVISDYGRSGLLRPISVGFWSRAITQEISKYGFDKHFQLDVTSKEYVFVTSIGLVSNDGSRS